MINITFAITQLGIIHKSIPNDENNLANIILDLINQLTIYSKCPKQNERKEALLKADCIAQKLLLPENNKIAKYTELMTILKQLTKYCEAKIQKHLKINGILHKLPFAELLLITLRSNNDYGSAPLLGLGREPYLPSRNNKVRLKSHAQPVTIGTTLYRNFDDRRALDGRGIALTLRHRVEKYDHPLHRPWRNFIYRNYNEIFDFWLTRVRKVELHLIYPEQADEYKTRLGEWINKVHTYNKDLLIIFNPISNNWEAHIRDETLENKYTTVIIESKSPLMAELRKINASSCRMYDRNVLEQLIVATQPFASVNTVGYHFYKENSHFYSWVEKNVNVKDKGHVLYFNPLQSASYVVRINENMQLCYLNGEIVQTPDLRDERNRPQNFIFAIDMNGNLYIAKEGPINPAQPDVRIQHPSFTNGARVVLAGTLKVKDGKIISIDNASGHYIPGEFSLLKAILEFERLGVLHKDCVVDFATMNKNEIPYIGKKPVGEFIQLVKEHFLSVLEDTPREYNNLSPEKREKIFNYFWQRTDLGKLRLRENGRYSATCDFLLDDIASEINSIGRQTSNSFFSSANELKPHDYHAIRSIWIHLLQDLANGVTQAIIPTQHILSTLSAYLTKSYNPVQERFVVMLKKIHQEILAAQKINVECTLNLSSVLQYLRESNLRHQFAKICHAPAKFGAPVQIDKLSDYKQFLLTNTSQAQSFLSPAEMVAVENRNLSGLTK